MRKRLLKVTDQRIGLTSEVLTHARTVKLENWEGYVSQRIDLLRNEEVRFQKRLALLSAIVSFCTASSAPFAMLVIFGTHVYRGGTLNTALIFSTLAYLGALRFALGNLPETIFNFVDASVSLSRICTFLAAKERHLIPQNICQPVGEVVLRDTTWSWEEAQVALKVKELTIHPGELLAVVGGSGGGKTALLLALLGELEASSGEISLHGSVAYVAQEAWIISDSIRNNIVCGLSFDEDRYKQALRTSALEVDLQSFPNGDLTEIGERGVTLSGGQRQRVALARAFYAQADIYLFDDPLSALDPTVAHQVFYGMIRGELRNTTRILVTHRLEYALLADRVAVIENGSLLEVATPVALRQNNPRFRELVEIHEETNLSHPKEGSSSYTVVATQSPTLQGDEEVYQPPHLETPQGRTVVEEERARGAVDIRTLLQYMARLVPHWAPIVLVGLFALRQGLSVVGDIWIAKFSATALLNIPLFIGGYAAIVLSLAAMNFLRSLFMFWRGISAGIHSHTLLIRGILHAPIRFFEANPVGRILNRFSRDLETVEIMLPRALQDTLHCMAEVIAVVVLILIVQPAAAICILPLVVIYIRLLKAFRPTAREGQRLESITRSPIFATLSESLRGTETLRASNAQGVFGDRFNYFQDQNARAFISLAHPNRWLGVRLECLGALLLLIVGFLAAFLPSSPLRAAVSGLTLTYVMMSLGALNWLIRSLSQVESNLTSFERIEAYSQVASENWQGTEPPSSWPENGKIAFHDLSVRYRPDLPPAISHLSCTIPAGARIGIIGRTGSGKSTLIASLMRLIEPSEGEITIDDVSTTTIPLERLRSSITVIPQEPVLFAGTVRDALDPMHTFSDDEVWRALERVELAGFVKQLPCQLLESIREGGGNLSVGQRQLFCLARALLKKNRIIVMDEATANIDVQTDYAIQRTIRRECAGVTILVVAHRLGTVLDSDILLVMENGSLRECGRPQELLADRNSFLTRVTSQIVDNS
jgi:ATP-binding cassette subfamily C (CFTR/MRP) protein 1